MSVSFPFRRNAALAGLLCALAAAPLAPPAQAEVLVRGQEGRPLAEARPAPGALRPDHAIVVAQPSPSEVNPSFLGPVLLMKSAHVDLEKGTATLPLRRGRLASGEAVWFILTDVSDRDIAELQGLVYSAKFAFAFTGQNRRTAEIQRDGTFVFNQGRIDFAPRLSITPGPAPDPFPPKAFQPGAVADADYTPVVHITNSGKGLIYNAPMLAFNVTAEQLDRFCDGGVDHDLVHD